jgi:hypothetical protein
MTTKRLLRGLLALLLSLALVSSCSGMASSSTPDTVNCDPTRDQAAGCNQIGGFSGNEVTTGVVGATIGGGGDQWLRNRVIGNFGTVAGGLDNTAGDRATVGGGTGNRANGFRSVVGGGSQNVADNDHTTVAGGVNNLASYTQATIGGGGNNVASGRDSTISGGSGNNALFTGATVGGGSYNIAGSINTTVGGGEHNTASGAFSTIGGGSSNVAGEYNAAVGGGSGNVSSADSATIAGGLANHATDKYSVVGGGDANVAGNSNDDLRDAQYSTVSGGSHNNAGGLASTVAGGTLNSATGAYATIPGGTSNTAAGDYSFAVGRRANVQPDHRGTFLFADSNDAPFDSSTADEFAARATGGVRFVTAIDSSGKPIAGVRLVAGSGSWETLSDRNAKTNFSPVDEQAILQRVAALPISLWSYKTQSTSIRHIGPMAQDFYTTFGLGTDDRYISTVDIEGVALAAIQGVNQIIRNQADQIAAQQQQIATLESEIAAQRTQLTEIEARLSALEQNKTITTPTLAGSSWEWLLFAIVGLIGLSGIQRAIRQGRRSS